MRISIKRHSFFILTVLYLGLLFSVSFAQSKLLDKVIQKFNSEKSISVEVAQIGSATKGKIFFEFPDKEKIVLNNSEIIVVADTVWNYNFKLNRLVIQERTEEFSPFFLLDILYKLPSKCTYSENSAHNQFTLKPLDEQKLNFRLVSVAVGKNTLPKSISLIDINGNKYSFSLNKYILGKKYDDRFFTVKPKKGTKIVDLR
jgi:outer membrane lipoprotein-sorting protein